MTTVRLSHASDNTSEPGIMQFGGLMLHQKLNFGVALLHCIPACSDVNCIRWNDYMVVCINHAKQPCFSTSFLILTSCLIMNKCPCLLYPTGNWARLVDSCVLLDLERHHYLTPTSYLLLVAVGVAWDQSGRQAGPKWCYYDCISTRILKTLYSAVLVPVWFGAQINDDKRCYY